MNIQNLIEIWKNPSGFEPDEERKSKGFEGKYYPPAGIFNWLFNKSTEAINELQKACISHETEGLHIRGMNPLTSVAEDTPAKWKELGTGIWLIDLPNQIIGQPSQWGFLYNTVCLEEISQEFVVQASGERYRRNANGIGWYGTDWQSGEWTEMFDFRKPQCVMGVYYGDFNEKDSYGSQFIDLGFTPRAVFVTWHDVSLRDSGKSLALAIKDHPTEAVEIVENGFKATQCTYNSTDEPELNYKGQKYSFIAYR